MKADKPDRNIEEIFRETFQDFEVTPNKGFWPRFEKKLRAREFLRFNPGRFNLYYLGAIVASAVISLSVLLKDRSVDDIVKSSPSTVKVETGLTAQRSVVIAEDKAVKLSKGSVEASQRVSTIETDKVVSAMDKPDNRIRGEVVESLKIDNTGLEGNIVGSENEIIASGELIKPDPSAGFDIDIISGCVPLKVSFNNLSMNYDSCIWEFGDGGYSNVREPVWIFDEDGEYNVKLIVFGDDQAASANSTVTVHPLPLAKFEVNSRDPMLPDEQVMFYNYSENSVEWKWEFGDGESSYGYEPAHQYKKYDSYSVKLLAISEYGCKDSLIITNAFGVNSCYLKFPNAFIPNDGGPTGGYYSSRTDIESEVFHPVWSGVTEYNLKIFSRTGIMIFESNDINIGWDGYNRGQKVEPGVYIWKVRGVFKNGDPFVQKGDITLVPKR